VLLDWAKVADVYCGQSHWSARTEVGYVRAIYFGGTHTTKRLEVLEV